VGAQVEKYDIYATSSPRRFSRVAAHAGGSLI